VGDIDLEALSTEDHGYTVNDEDDDEPILLDCDGNPVETWRENYPYDEKMPRDEYEWMKRRLQIELLKLQNWIKRFMEHLNPRGAHVVALEKPSERESTQWYFQRYIAHLPSGGEIVLFDRSWYNRAGVERVMGFCTDEQYAEFIKQAPLFEEMLVQNGISLTKFWCSVSPAEQRTPFAIRLVDPVRQWKFSPMDMESLNRWDDYTCAKETMFEATDTDVAPWIVVKSNDKKRARINSMRYVLGKFEYDDKDHELVGEADPLIVGRALAD